MEDRPGIPFPRGYLSLDPIWWWWNTPTLGGSVSMLLIISLIASVVMLRRKVEFVAGERASRALVLAVGINSAAGAIDGAEYHRVWRVDPDAVSLTACHHQW